MTLLWLLAKAEIALVSLGDFISLALSFSKCPSL